jgi:hypothetical protein
MISVGDILARLDELAAVVRARPARRVSMGRRVAPWIAAAMVILIVILVAVVIYAYLQGTHQYTTKPGLQ